VSPDRARADEAQIRAALADWVKSFNAGDYARAATIWAPDLVGWYPGGADDTYAEEVERARRPRDPDAPRVEYALTIVEVMVSGDLAVVRDEWTETVAPRAPGAPTKRTTFRSYEVWRRQADASWRIARWIDAVPPAKSGG
jgi:ketosteroid isomerase-like protein